MKRVVISCGPIPARVDSVKYITNRFKGQLAFRTAQELLSSDGFRVTVVKWKHTPLPNFFTHTRYNCEEIVNVSDVFEYYNWFETHADEYDAFVMAAAVANLTPVAPWKGKFPSHLYQPGESFPIEFQIAPRAIDVIKKKNPRCCLIGYKLFDAANDEELIEVAAHTLKDSKANIIFANTPDTAKKQKIALMQDGACIKMTYDEHNKFIAEAINAEYFETVVQPLLPDEECDQDIKRAFAIVEMFERTFPKYGTVAVPVHGRYIATTARGHHGTPVLIRDIDFEKGIVYATGKATLNAPTLFGALSAANGEHEWDDKLFLVHRHLDDPGNPINKGFEIIPYTFPGTLDEVRYVVGKVALHKALGDSGCPPIRIMGHGDLYFRKIGPVDWARYYQEFPEKYFGTPPVMQEFIDHYKGSKTLEVGGNREVQAKYAYDPFVKAENALNLPWDEVCKQEFDLIIAKNSINYLPLLTLSELLRRTKHFIANTFLVPPEKKITDREVALCESGTIDHVLRLANDDLTEHQFFAYTEKDYKDLGFKIFPYGINSAFLQYDA